MPLAGAKVYVHGRLRGVTHRRVESLVAAVGGSATRRGAAADIIVLGHASASTSLTAAGDIAFGFQPTPAATRMSENMFKRRVARLPDPALPERAYSAADLVRLSGLTPGQVRSLTLYDVLTDLGEPFGYADLVAARAMQRMLGSGAGFGKIVAAALALADGGASFARAKLAESPWGEVLQEVEGRLARLDGQFLLPLPDEPANADDVFARAEAAEAEGRPADAIRWYALAARLDGGDAVIPFNLGNVLDGLGRSSEAEIAYRQAIARDRGFADAWFNLAVLQQRAGRADAALASYRQAYAADPAYGDALHNAAVLLMEAKKFGDAAVLWDRIVHADSEGAAEARRYAHLCRLESTALRSPGGG